MASEDTQSDACRRQILGKYNCRFFVSSISHAFERCAQVDAVAQHFSRSCYEPRVAVEGVLLAAVGVVVPMVEHDVFDVVEVGVTCRKKAFNTHIVIYGALPLVAQGRRRHVGSLVVRECVEICLVEVGL